MYRAFYALIFMLVASLATTAYAQVVPDGGTQTTATTAANGHVTVNIAPVFTGVTGDISHNTYTDFNVGAAGVSLDNSVVDARTIVNQVTSTNPSHIQGELEVLGSPAHVILANPNGITINGGSFYNTGNVALTTGSVSYVDRAVTPITTQRNVLLSTNRGTIRVEGDGLSGVFTRLELIAKKIEIDGAVDNQLPISGGLIRLVGGNSNVELDSSISIVDTIHPWSYVSEGSDVAGDDCPNAICVDITGLGSLTSSKVEIAVTEKGAGVNLSGIAASTLDDVTITAQGKILIDGHITSAGSNFIGNRTTDGHENVTSTTEQIVISGNGKVEASSANVLTADQEIRLTDNGTVSAGANILDAQNVRLLSSEGTRPSLIALSGTNNISASNEFENAGSDIVAADNNLITSGYFLSRAVQGSDGHWHDSSIVAVDGGTIIETTLGDIVNNGGTIQGNSRIASDARSEGAVTLISANEIYNRTLDSEALGIIFGAEDDVVTHSVGNIYNIFGRFISNHDVIFNSTNGTLFNMIEKTDVANEGELVEYRRKGSRTFFRRKRIRGSSIAFGDALVEGENAYITAGNNVVINTKNVENRGGEIYAQGGKIIVNTENLTTEMELAGSAYAETVCAWWCNNKGGGNISTYGGTLRALGNIELNVSGKIINSGGAFQSVEGDLILHSPNPIIVESKPVFSLIKMDRGIFRKDFIRLLKYDQGGALVANMGKLSATSLIVLDGGYIDVQEEDLQGGKEVVSEPETKPDTHSGGHIGALDFML
jgi:filamentous hemagglutinin family protein